MKIAMSAGVILIFFISSKCSEYLGDALYAMRYEDSGKALEAAYEYLDGADRDPHILFKALLGYDFSIMYNGKASVNDKIQMYKSLIDSIGIFFKQDTFNTYYHLSLAVIYGRCGQICDIGYSIRKNIPGKIFQHASSAYDLNRGLYDWTLPLILGKLHLETPKIPFVYSWPDIKKAEAFLLENIEMSTHKLRGKYYLAGLRKKQGRIEECRLLLDEIITAEIDSCYLYEDLEVISSAREMKIHLK